MLESVALTVSSSAIRNWMLPSPIITPDTGIATALRLLREHKLPALPVVEGGRLVGMVYEKDLLRLAPSEATTLDVYELHAALDQLTVRRVVRPVTGLCAAATVQEALAVVGRDALEAVPVFEEQRVLGLLTWPALMRAAGAELARQPCLESGEGDGSRPRFDRGPHASSAGLAHNSVS